MARTVKAPTLKAGHSYLNVATLQPASLGAHSAPAVALAFRNDGRVAASSSPVGPKIKSRLGKGSEVKLWDVVLRRELCTLHGHRNTVTALAFSPDGSLLLTASQDGAVGVWDVTPGLYDSVLGTRIHTIKDLPAQVVAMSFLPDGGGVLMADATGKISLWSTAGWEVKKSLKSRAGDCKFALSPDGSLLAAIWRSPGPVSLWHTIDWEEQEPLRLRREEDHENFGLAFADDGALAVLSADECRVWELAYRQVEYSFATESCRSIACVNERALWALGGWDSKSNVCGWLRERATGAVTAVFEAPGRPCSVLGVCRGNIVTAHADFTVNVWPENNSHVATGNSAPAATDDSTIVE